MEKDLEILKTICTALDDKMGIDIVVLDIIGISSLTDYFVIASANNERQTKSMAEEVERKLHEINIDAIHTEGYQTSNWILLDFGNIIVHIFDKDTRGFYNLERTWGDAKIVNI